jgi:polyisoprenyl-teichoic acid--peptidoglycan teichoic acid transferase
MSDEELPKEDSGGAGADPEIPPPSTFAGRARHASESESEASNARGMTEELEGLADELSAEWDTDAEDESAAEARGAEAAGEEEPAPHPADEEEDPPSEFAFEDDEEATGGAEEEEAEVDEADEEEAEADGDEEPGAQAAHEGSEPEPEPAAPETIEADTLMLADAEAAREAAAAGLAKRAKCSAFSQQKTTSSHKVQPAPRSTPAPPPAPHTDTSDEGVGEPPRRRVGLRFVAAAFVIVSSMAAATAVSFLLFLSDIAEGLNDPELSAARSQLESVEGGDPQTILILGSDQRTTNPGDPGRSDTAMLLRVDPDKEFLSLMSLPRDLEVPIPGYGPNKLNAAYTFGEQENPDGGGTELALRTIKDYLDIPINHVVNVNFNGFMDAVNAIGCVYIDVDRHYFNPTGGVYAEIDVEAGYQRLCGYKALQYVRYRHNDNDLVRGARQQDFIREARQRIPPADLLPVFGRGDELIDIFTENTSSDINDPATIIEMMKSFAAIRNVPVRQVSLGTLSPDGGVQASPAQVQSALDQFLGADIGNDSGGEQTQPQPQEPKPQTGGNGGGQGGGDSENGDKSAPPPSPEAEPLVDFVGPSAEKAALFTQELRRGKSDLPVYYPTKLVQQASTQISDESRTAVLLGPSGKPEYQMYKFVIPYQEEGAYGAFTSYYGVSGTDWEEPPILKDPNEIRTIDGRDYLLFYEDSRLRLVGWKTQKGSYWVINTLTHALTEEQMLGIASTTRVAGQ